MLDLLHRLLINHTSQLFYRIQASIQVTFWFLLFSHERWHCSRNICKCRVFRQHISCHFHFLSKNQVIKKPNQLFFNVTFRCIQWQVIRLPFSLTSNITFFISNVFGGIPSWSLGRRFQNNFFITYRAIWTIAIPYRYFGISIESPMEYFSSVKYSKNKEQVSSIRCTSMKPSNGL